QSHVALGVSLHEYSGAYPTSPLDTVSENNTGDGFAIDSGSRTTNFASELIFGYGAANLVSSPWAGFTSRNTLNGNMTEDRNVSSVGTYNATETADGSPWSMQMATFRASNSPVALMLNS